MTRPPAMHLKEAMERVLRRAQAGRDGTPGARAIEEPRTGLAEAMRIVQRRHAARCGEGQCPGTR